MPDGTNSNQGAESTLAWLISLLTMFELEERKAFEDSMSEANAGNIVK